MQKSTANLARLVPMARNLGDIPGGGPDAQYPGQLRTVREGAHRRAPQGGHGESQGSMWAVPPCWTATLEALKPAIDAGTLSRSQAVRQLGGDALGGVPSLEEGVHPTLENRVPATVS